mgnify:CR=1 FL=1
MCERGDKKCSANMSVEKVKFIPKKTSSSISRICLLSHSRDGDENLLLTEQTTNRMEMYTFFHLRKKDLFKERRKIDEDEFI